MIFFFTASATASVRPSANAQFIEDADNMGLYGALADTELAGDLLVSGSGGHDIKHFDLSLRKAVSGGAGRLSSPSRSRSRVANPRLN